MGHKKLRCSIVDTGVYCRFGVYFPTREDLMHVYQTLRSGIVLAVCETACPILALLVLFLSHSPAIGDDARVFGVDSERVDLTIQWVLSGDDEDIVFGLIGGADVDPDGNVYVLDSQLKSVFVVDPQGEIVRRMGRAGSGPGELMNPSDLILGLDGEVLISEHWPSRIVWLRGDGNPFRTIDPSMDLMDYAIYVIHKVDYSSGVLASMMSQRNYEGGKEFQISRMVSLGNDSKIATEYMTWKTEHDSRREVIDETAGYFPARAWCLLSDGTLAIAPNRDEFLIEFYNPNGHLLDELKLDYRSPKRTSDEIDRIKQMKKKFVNGKEVPLNFKLEDSDPAIIDMQRQLDGTVWVATSMSSRDLPHGVSARYLVVEDKGSILREVLLSFENRKYFDRFWLLRDGSVLQAKNYYNQSLSTMGTLREDTNIDNEGSWDLILWK